MDEKISVRYMEEADIDFWFTLDKHLAVSEFHNIAGLKRGYILLKGDKPIGVLRYNLLWDSVPICTMLFLDWDEQRKGYGSFFMTHWENDMKKQGYDMIMTSTQVDETSQHFYRKLGYQDMGCMVLTIPGHEQPMEMFMAKPI